MRKVNMELFETDFPTLNRVFGLKCFENTPSNFFWSFMERIDFREQFSNNNVGFICGMFKSYYVRILARI